MKKQIVAIFVVVLTFFLFALCFDCNAKDGEQYFYIPVWTMNMLGQPVPSLIGYDTLQEALDYCRENEWEECPVFQIKFVDCEYKKAKPVAPDGTF